MKNNCLNCPFEEFCSLKNKRHNKECKAFSTAIKLLEYTKKEGRPPSTESVLGRRVRYYFNRSPYDFLVELSLKGIINEKLELKTNSKKKRKTLKTNCKEFIDAYFIVSRTGSDMKRGERREFLQSYLEKHGLTREELREICLAVEKKRARVRVV